MLEDAPLHKVQDAAIMRQEKLVPNAGEVRVCTTTADDLDDFPRTHKDFGRTEAKDRANSSHDAHSSFFDRHPAHLAA